MNDLSGYENVEADDLILPFRLGGGALRGRAVRLGPAVDAIVLRHGYPEPVAVLLAEALALAAGLAALLKFEGIFTLQAKGEGPVRTLVADYRKPGHLRGYVGFDRDGIAELQKAIWVKPPLRRLMGPGYLAFTVDQGDQGESYQGLVKLEGESLAECAEAYFRQSEQIPTKVRLEAGRVAASAEGAGTWRAGCLILQRVPGEGGAVEDDAEDLWPTALGWLDRLQPGDLIDPARSAPLVLSRAFREGVHIHPPTPLIARCRCSRERAEVILRSFSAEEIAGMTVEGKITVTCEFCSTTYGFLPAAFAFVTGSGSA